MKSRALTLLILLFSACSSQNAVTVALAQKIPLEVFTNARESRFIGDWLLVKSLSSEQVDELLRTVSSDEFEKVLSSCSVYEFRNVKGAKNLDILETFSISDGDADGLIVVGATKIHVEKDIILYCLIGCDDVLNIAINGTVKHKIFKRKDPRRPVYVVDLALKAGDNFISISLKNINNSMGFTLRPCESLAEAVYEVINNQTSLFEKLVISKGGKITFRTIEGLDTTIEANINTQVFDRYGNNMIKMNYSAGLSPISTEGFEDGFYTVLIKIGDKTISEKIFIGDADTATTDLTSEILSRNDLEESIKYNVIGLARRLSIVMKAENRKEDDENWQFKTFNYLDSLQQIVTSLYKKLNPYDSLTGFRVKSFKSKIDGQILTYQYGYPKVKLSEAPPIYIIAPTMVTGQRPFYETPIMAAHLSGLNITTIAAEQGAAVLWVGYRNKTGGPLMDLAHFEEVMSDFGSEFKYDSERIYLVGSCAGAASVALYTTAWPSRFAAIAFHNPAIQPSIVKSYTDVGQFYGNSDYLNWKKHFDPITQFSKIQARCPMLIYYDEGNGGDLTMSELLLATLQRNELSVEFKESRKGFGQDKDMDVLFRWCAGKRRLLHSADSYSINAPGYSGIGPLARCFTDRFIVVVGSGGSEIDKAANKRLADLFQNTWISTNYDHCLLIKDTELTESDYKMNNLVLIGNPETNIIWKRLNNGFHCKVYPDGISIDQKTWSSSSLGVQVIESHPDAVGHTIVLIGGPTLSQVRFRSLNLCNDGWFDYAIWSFDKRTQLLEATYFSDTKINFN